MSSRKGRVCYLGGNPCFGRTCQECFNKGKYSSIAKLDASRRNYVKQVQH